MNIRKNIVNRKNIARLLFIVMAGLCFLLASLLVQSHRDQAKILAHAKWWELPEGPIPHSPDGQPDPHVPTLLGHRKEGPDIFQLVQILDGQSQFRELKPSPWAGYGNSVVVVADFAKVLEMGLWQPMYEYPLPGGGYKYAAKTDDPYAEDMLFFFANSQRQITSFSVHQAETDDKNLAKIMLPMPISLRTDRAYSVTITGDSVPSGVWIFQFWQGHLVQSIAHLAGDTPDPPLSR